MHTNQAAFRQYTDYNSDGSLRTSSLRKRPLSYDAASNVDSISLGTSIHVDFVRSPHQMKPIPGFFDPELIRIAFAHPFVGPRLRQFAKGTHCAADMEFLVKVDEYMHALGSMTRLIGQISSDYTGLTATSPLELPADMSNILRSNTKSCARLALPQLERLYRDAKLSVEDRLGKTLYPEFLKYQLAQCMRSSLSVSRSLTGGFKSAYPGLGDAFCLTDPLEPDNPIVYASDGMVNMTGYERSEIMNRNCRLLQGISTDSEASRRIREAVWMGQETTELILNYRKDGTPFWNLLFMCPLFEQGSLRYCLGGQINVSESMGTEPKDVMRVLNFRLPGEDLTTSPVVNTQERPVWKSPSNSKQETSETSPPDLRKRPYRHRFLRRFSKKSKAARAQAQTMSAALGTESTPSAKRRAYSPRMPQLEQQVNEFSTPYSRFFVMRYVPTTSTASGNTNSPHTQMPVAFCSSFALELLGLKSSGGCGNNGSNETDSATEHVLGKDIFTLLSEHANSPSINRSFKSTVLDRIASGDTVSMDLLTSIDASSSSSSTHRDQTGSTPQKHSRNGSLIRGAVMNGGGANGHDASTESRPRLSDTLDRGAEILSNVFFGPKMRKLVSHWAPLKDEAGDVGWVVLVLTGASVS